MSVGGSVAQPTFPTKGDKLGSVTAVPCSLRDPVHVYGSTVGRLRCAWKRGGVVRRRARVASCLRGCCLQAPMSSRGHGADVGITQHLRPPTFLKRFELGATIAFSDIRRACDNHRSCFACRPWEEKGSTDRVCGIVAGKHRYHPVGTGPTSGSRGTFDLVAEKICALIIFEGR